MTIEDVVRRLQGGDRRSVGEADAVAACVEQDPARFDALWQCLGHLDPLVRMRAADALEKASRSSAMLFEPHRQPLLDRRLEDGSAEMRWHLIAITSRLRLHVAEARAFNTYLDDRLRRDGSRIVKVMALQAAFDISRAHAALAADFATMLAFARSSAWPSVVARARMLGVLQARSEPKS